MTKNTDNRIPFGLRDGEPVEVSEVESGLACGCVCPACKGPLQARKGKIRAHHFAHDPSADAEACTTGLETSVHLMATKILEEEGYLGFPELTITRTAEDAIGRTHTMEAQVEESGERLFENVELEKRLDDIRPDIVAYVKNEPMIVEIAVTSFVGNEKKEKIRSLGFPAVEIDLGSVSYSITKAELKDLIYSESAEIKWVSNPKAIQVIDDLCARLEATVRQINEEYRAAARKAAAQEALSSNRRQSQALAHHRQIHTAKTSEKTRWFVCEDCRDIFELPVSAAPQSIRTVPCPSCDHAVSASRPRHNF